MVSIDKVVKVANKVAPYYLEEVVQKHLGAGKIEPVEN